MRFPLLRATLAALACLLALPLGGCSSPAMRDANPAAALLPADWFRKPETVQPAAVDTAWWRNFANPELDALIDRAERQSHDLAAAIANVRQARALAGAAGAARWPALDLLVTGKRGDATGSSRNDYAATLTAAYELDVWGRVRATHESALATALASTYDAQAIRLGIQASVANAWLESVALRQRLSIGEQDRRDARQTLTLIEARQAAGAATELDLARQRGVVAEREKSLAVLQRQLADNRVLLARLLGEAGSRDIATASLDEVGLPAIDSGLPSELLRRRPDLARAEAQLQAADADLAAARAALLPTINLSAALSGGNGELLKVMENPAYSLLTAIAAPIFNAGRLSALRDGARARQESLLAAYRSAIVAAFADSQGALDAIAGNEAQQRAQQAVLREAERAWRLADVRYRAGAAGMLDLLDAQRTLHAARSDAVQLQLLRLQARVSLYRALGGGWQKVGG